MPAAYNKEVRFVFTGDEGAAQARIPRARVLLGMALELSPGGMGYVHRRFSDQDGADYEIHVVNGLPPTVHIDVAQVVGEPRILATEDLRLLWQPEGFYLTPKRDSDARWGWGAPRRQVNGEPINPPFGTAYNGDEDEGALKQVVINRYKHNKHIDSLAELLAADVAEMSPAVRVQSASLNFYDYEIIGWIREDTSGTEEPIIRQIAFNDDSDQPEDHYYTRFENVFFEAESDEWHCHWPEELYTPESFAEYSYQYVEAVRGQVHLLGGGLMADYEPITRPMRGFNADLADKIVELMRQNTLIAHDSPEYAEEYATFGRRVSAFGTAFMAAENLQFLTQATLSGIDTVQEYAQVTVQRYANSPGHLQNMIYPWTDQENNLSGSVRITQAPGTRVVGDDVYTGAYNAHIFVGQQYSVQPNYATQQLENRDVGLLADDGQDIPRYEHRRLHTFGSGIAVFNRELNLSSTVLGAGVWRDSDTDKLWLVWLDWDEESFRLRGTPWGVRYVSAGQIDEESVTTFAVHTSNEPVTSATRALFSDDGSKCVIQYAYELGVINNWIRFNQKNFNLDSTPSNTISLGYEGMRIVELHLDAGVNQVADNTPMITVTASSEEVEPAILHSQSGVEMISAVWENIYSAHCSEEITAYPAYDANQLVTCSILVELHYDAYSKFHVRRHHNGELDFIPWGDFDSIVENSLHNSTVVSDARTLVFPNGAQHQYKYYTHNSDPDGSPYRILQYLPGESYEDNIAYLDPLKPEDTSYVRTHYKAERDPGWNTFRADMPGQHEVFLRNKLQYTHPPVNRTTGMFFQHIPLSAGPHTGQFLMLFTHALGAVRRTPSTGRSFFFSPTVAARIVNVARIENNAPPEWFCGPNDSSDTHYRGDSPREDYGFSFTQLDDCVVGRESYWHSTPILPLPTTYGAGVSARHEVRGGLVEYGGEVLAAIEVRQLWSNSENLSSGEGPRGVDYTSQDDQTGRFFVESSLDLEELTGVQDLSPDIWPFGRI